MNYPLDLLPQPFFCVPFPFDILEKKFGGYAVCYRIAGTIKDNCEIGYFDGHKVLKESCFEHIVHLSMNLLGGAFKPEYVRFVPKKPGCDDWMVGEIVDFKKYKDCIEEYNEYSPVFYHNDILCQPSISVGVVFNDKQAYKAFCQYFKEKSFPQYKDGALVEMKFKTSIAHRPTNLNYWHVQLEVYPELKEEMLKNDSGIWRKRIYNHIRSAILCHKFEEKLPFSYNIPTELYNHKS